MLEFIQSLKQRYQTVIRQLDRKNPLLPEYEQRIDQLLFAEALLRKSRLLNTASNFPLQIAVIGPTQSGKSTLVNLLLGSEAAGVSPLAGYTVHPQGFGIGLAGERSRDLQHYFGRYQRLAPDRLNPSRYDCYSLVDLSSTTPLLPDCVVWDTPDFDSIDAADYKEGVLRTLALADALLLVVSKEKYADQAVWQTMAELEDLQQPVLICLNKLAEGSEKLLIDSLRQKWQQARSDAFPPIVPILFKKQSESLNWPAEYTALPNNLCKRVERSRHEHDRQRYLTRHWPQWLAPVLAEHQAQQHWQTLIAQSVAQTLKDYQRDYLDHPLHYETFQKALVNLLNLLEIPGFATLLGKTRRIMTWPIRTLLKAGDKNTPINADQEAALLQQLAEHLLIRLAEQVLDKAEADNSNAAWWRQVYATLRRQKPMILSTFKAAAQRYQTDFQQDVEAAAQRLYSKLQDQPLTLNSLRATRATTDAAALALAVHTGGIGLHDLLITPAMLTITSLLAESAIGSYMHRVEAELKQQQLNTVKTELFTDCLQPLLEHLPQDLTDQLRFNITPQQLQQAESVLKEKKHGLRIL